jgi:hypothetical protein
MQTTFTELVLTPVYRHAQRALAQWLEHGQGAARQLAFRARVTLAQLDPVERHRMARWLAWMSVAEHSRGRRMLDTRLKQLDGALHLLMLEALQVLPATAMLHPAVRRRSA